MLTTYQGFFLTLKSVFSRSLLGVNKKIYRRASVREINQLMNKNLLTPFQVGKYLWQYNNKTNQNV